MKDGGAIILIIAGLLTSVQFITVNIIVPYNNKYVDAQTKTSWDSLYYRKDSYIQYNPDLFLLFINRS